MIYAILLAKSCKTTYMGMTANTPDCGPAGCIDIKTYYEVMGGSDIEHSGTTCNCFTTMEWCEKANKVGMCQESTHDLGEGCESKPFYSTADST